MYDYDTLRRDGEEYAKKGVEVFSIGKSTEGREILCFATGKGRTIISTAAIHARENAVAYVVKAQLDYALEHYAGGRICVVPLANPDGAELLSRGFRGETKYLAWKANARGVDLNVNFDARWGSGKSNVFTAGSENYVGPFPFSEPESRALRDFTERENPIMTLSYHTMGRELYWYFFQSGEIKSRDLEIAKFAEKHLKYKYERIDGDCKSAGGYKDYCVEKLGISALTLEIGTGKHPLTKADIALDVELNSTLVAALFKHLKEKNEL